MPSINTPTPATVKVISASRGIKFYNPQSNQVEEIQPGNEIPVTATLEFGQDGELTLNVNGEQVVIQGSAATRQSLEKTLSGFYEAVVTDQTEPATTYQPLPELKKPGEYSSGDLTPAKTSGFHQPVIEKNSTSELSSPYELVAEDISARRTELSRTLSDIINDLENVPEELEAATGERVTIADADISLQPATLPAPPVPGAPQIEGIRPDSGTSAKDMLTNSRTFTIFGTAPANSAVELSCDGSTLFSKIAVNSQSLWSYEWTAPRDVKDGNLNFVAKTIVAGVRSLPSDTAPVMLKSTGPELKISQEILNTTSLTLTTEGKTEGLIQVKLTCGDDYEQSAQTNPDGTFSFNLDLRDKQLESKLTEDKENKLLKLEYLITAEDNAGNITINKPLFITASTAPFNIRIEPDTGIQSDDLISSDYSFVVKGEKLAGYTSPVSVKVGDQPAVQAVLVEDGKDGSWTLPDTVKVPADGTYDIKAWYGTLEAPVENKTATVQVTIDSTAPTFDDPGFLSEPVFSKLNPPVLDVETAKGNRVTASLIDPDSDNIVAKAEGVASSTAHLVFPQRVPEGKYNIKVELESPSGKTISKDGSWIVDQTPPTLPVIESVPDATSVDNGINYLPSNRFTVKVQAEESSTNTFQTPDGKTITIIGDPVIEGNNFTYTLETDQAGPVKILCQSQDRAENTSISTIPVVVETITADPKLSKVVIPDNQLSLKQGDALEVEVRFDQKVKISGAEPRLKLLLNQTEVTASFDRITDNNTIVFKYLVESGNTADAGVIVPADAIVNLSGITGRSNRPIANQTEETLISSRLVDTQPPEIPTFSHLSTNSADNPSFTTNKVKFDLVGKAPEEGIFIQLYQRIDESTSQKFGDPVTSLKDKSWMSPMAGQSGQAISIDLFARTVDKAGNESADSEVITVISDPTPLRIDDIKGANPDTVHTKGDTVSVTVTFNKNITVEGNPGLNLLLGNKTVIAPLNSQKNTENSITFEYKVSEVTPSASSIVIPKDTLVLSELDIISDNATNIVQTQISTAKSLSEGVDTLPLVVEVVPLAAPGIYTAGDQQQFEIRFSKPVIVDSKSSTGPLLKLSANGQPVDALLSSPVSSTAVKKLTFGHTVAAGQDAPDGIKITGLDLNGSTISDSIQQPLTDKGFAARDLPEHIWDVTPPQLLKIEAEEPAGFIYAYGSKIHLKLDFSEPVSVIGSQENLPFIPLQIGDSEKGHLEIRETDNFEKIIHLAYDIQKGDSGKIRLGVLELNQAKIIDKAGQQLDVSDLSGKTLDGYRVESSLPSIKNIVTSSEAGIYTVDQKIDFRVHFNKSVTIDKQGGDTFPELVLMVGETPVKLPLVSEPAGAVDTLTFSYTITEGHNADSLTISELLLNGASLIDEVQQTFEPGSFKSQTFTEHKIDTQAPDLTSVTLDSNAPESYVKGDTVRLKLDFSEPVQISVPEGKQAPTLALVIGKETIQIPLAPTKTPVQDLSLKYLVQKGDSGKLSVGALNLNEGKLTDAASLELNSFKGEQSLNAQVVSTPVEHKLVSISAIEFLSDKTEYSKGDILKFKVTFSEQVAITKDVFLFAQVGDQAKGLRRSSDEAYNKAQKDFKFSAIVDENVDTKNGVFTITHFQTLDPDTLPEQYVTSASGSKVDLEFKPLTFPTLSIDSTDQTPPTISEVIIEAGPSPFGKGADLPVVLKFNKPVSVVLADQQTLPTISLKIAETTVVAQMQPCADKTSELTFIYKVEEGLSDQDGIDVLALDLKTAIIQSADNNIPLDPTTFKEGHIPEILVNSTVSVPPLALTEIKASPAGKVFTNGEQVEFTLHFNKPVTLNNNGGSGPELMLSVGAEIVKLLLSSVPSGAVETLSFSYTVKDGQNDADGLSVDALLLNEASITDATQIAYTTNNFPSQLFADYKVDTLAPSLSNVTLADGDPDVFSKDGVVHLKLAFSEPVQVKVEPGKSAPALALAIGEQTVQVPLTATTEPVQQLTLDYTVQASNNGALKVGALTLNEGTVTDTTGLPLTSFSGGQDLNAKVETTPDDRKPTTFGQDPITITDIKLISKKTVFKRGETLKFKVTFSDKVSITEDVFLRAQTSSEQGKGLRRSPDAIFGKGLKRSPDAMFDKERKDFKFSLKADEIIDTKHGVFSITKFQTRTPDIPPEQYITSAGGRKVNLKFGTFEFPELTVDSTDQTPPAVSEITIDAGSSPFGKGADLPVVLKFNKPVSVVFADQQTPTLSLRIGETTFAAQMQPCADKTSELTFIYKVEEGLSDQDGIDVLALDLKTAIIQGAENNVPLDLTTFKEVHKSEILVDSPAAPAAPAAPVIVDFESEPNRKFFQQGENITITATLSTPVTLSPDKLAAGSQLPNLLLEVGPDKKAVSIPLSNKVTNSTKLTFTFDITKEHLDTNGIKVVGLQLNDSRLEDANGNSLSTEFAPAQLNIFVTSEHPKILSVEGAMISGHSIIVTEKGADSLPTKVSVPEASAPLHISIREDYSSEWSVPEAVTSADKTTKNEQAILSFNLIETVYPKWIVPFMLSTRDGDVLKSQVYEIGFRVPSHKYGFDEAWQGNSPKIASLTFPAANNVLTIKDAQQVVQVPSFISSGKAIELKGGSLGVNGEFLTEALKGSFTVCSWIKTSITGSDKPCTSPSLIGKELAGNTGDMYLFTVDNAGRIGIVLGDRYGAMSDPSQINLAEGHHYCLTRTLSQNEQGTMSVTQLYVDGVAAGNPVEIPHKGHSSISEDQKLNHRSPEPELNITFDAIGQTGMASGGTPIPFHGIIDNLSISPFAMDGEDIGDVYSTTIHNVICSGQYPQPVGLYAFYARPDVMKQSKVYMKFTSAIEEVTVEENGQPLQDYLTVTDAQFKCTGFDSNFNYGEAYELDESYKPILADLQCSPVDNKISSYTVALDDSQSGAEGSAPDVLLEFGMASLDIDYDIKTHHNDYDGIQLGNSVLEAKKSVDWFTASESSTIKEVGLEDLVLLDEVPAIKELLRDIDSEKIQETLDNAFASTPESPRTYTIASSSQDPQNPEVILSVETQSLNQPFSVGYGHELYTIHPDHIV